jgi:hypothetical protein
MTPLKPLLGKACEGSPIAETLSRQTRFWGVAREEIP